MLSTEHRLQTLLGLQFSSTKRYSFLRAQSSIAATFSSSQAASSPESKLASTSEETMTATFHSTASMGTLLMNSPPIASRPTPPILRKAKSYAAQSSDSILIGSPKSNRASGTSNIPCKFYKNAACTAGANCPFLHSDNAYHAATTVCKYYLKGNCKFGSKCALLHSPPGSVASISSAGGRALTRGASADNIVSSYGWESSHFYETTKTDVPSSDESDSYFDAFDPRWQDGSSISNSFANVDSIIASPVRFSTSVEPPVTPHNRTEENNDIFVKGSSVHNYLHSPISQTAYIGSLPGSSYYNDDWSSFSATSAKTQDHDYSENPMLTSSFDEIIASDNSRKSIHPTEIKAIKRPSPIGIPSLSSSPSNTGLFGSSFTDKLNAIASQSYELEITKDILRVRNDRRRASDPSTTSRRTELCKSDSIGHGSECGMEDCINDTAKDTEEGPFVMDKDFDDYM
ncbi:hypothetical protein NQZ79_g2724 [Umbelopsis isabellina]|nr:hypothetical protein NQZ79_g2724 [Umbelopsis isabellina]